MKYYRLANVGEFGECKFAKLKHLHFVQIVIILIIFRFTVDQSSGKVMMLSVAIRSNNSEITPYKSISKKVTSFPWCFLDSVWTTRQSVSTLQVSSQLGEHLNVKNCVKKCHFYI
jgi:hypothetical protein